MGIVIKLFLLSFFSFALHVQGAPCSKSDIVVAQAKTGRIVEGKPEYEVTVSNNCVCAQSEVLLRCLGLSSIENVNLAAIRPVDAVNCLVHGGRIIVRGSPVKFNYAWMTPQDFPFVSSKIKC